MSISFRSIEALSRRAKIAHGDDLVPGRVDLSSFNNEWYDTGRSKIIRAVWYCVNAVVFAGPWVPFYGVKRRVLRWFGAKVGKHVLIKPRVNIKYPWNLEIGDHTWIGEGVWIDSLAKVSIGDNCCLSQGVYLCTGSHDWSDPAFGLIIKPIRLEEGVWCGCRSTVTPGITLASHTVLAAGSTITKDSLPYTVYQGVPAQAIKARHVSADPSSVGESVSDHTSLGDQARVAVG